MHRFHPRLFCMHDTDVTRATAQFCILHSASCISVSASRLLSIILLSADLPQVTIEARAAEAHAREQATMIKARQLAKSLGLEMKIGDVEYQGDGTKAIFYYIADGRVDFRQLIKLYAEAFRIYIIIK